MSPERRGMFRRAVDRISASTEDVEAAELRDRSSASGATNVCDCGDRDRVAVHGVLRAVTLRPRAGVPALEAELYDGSGAMTLLWLGRRKIGGIDPGRAVVATGRVAMLDGRRVMFNPTYELKPSGSA